MDLRCLAVSIALLGLASCASEEGGNAWSARLVELGTCAFCRREVPRTDLEVWGHGGKTYKSCGECKRKAETQDDAGRDRMAGIVKTYTCVACTEVMTVSADAPAPGC